MKMESSIFCSKCGERNPNLSNYCYKCGTELSKNKEKTQLKVVPNDNKNYNDIKEILEKIINKGGWGVISLGDFYVQFVKDFRKLGYLDLEAVSNNNNNQVGDKIQDFKNISFILEENGNYIKSIPITNISIEKIVSEIELIFENIYGFQMINYKIDSEIDVQTDSNNVNKHQFLCPSCGLQLYVPQEIVNEKTIQCPNCYTDFRNPTINQNSCDGISNTQEIKNWWSNGIITGGAAIFFGSLLCLTGIGAIIGVPLIIGGIAFPFINLGNSILVGGCPYCGQNIEALKNELGINCPSCKQRVIIRNKSFHKIQ